MLGSRRNHTVLFAVLTTLTVLLAIAPAWAQTAPETAIHVFLSGEDESLLVAPPPPRDSPLRRPTWEGGAALKDLVRAPIPSIPSGVLEEPVYRTAGPDLPPAEGEPQQDVLGQAGLGDAEPAPGPLADVDLPPPAIPAGAEEEGTGGPAFVEPAEYLLAPIPADTEGWGLLRLQYRAGQRVGLRTEVGLRTPAVSADLTLRAVGSDDLFPSPLRSPSSLGLKAALSYRTSAVDLGLSGQIVGQAETHVGRGGLATADSEIGLHLGRFAAGAWASGAVTWGGGDRAGILLPGVRGRLELGSPWGLPLAVAVGGLGLLGGQAGGEGSISLEAGPWRRTQSAAFGLSVGAWDRSVTLRPVARLAWGQEDFVLHLSAGTQAAHPDLADMAAEVVPDQSAARPERAMTLEAGAVLDRQPTGWLAGEASVRIGDLAWVLDGHYTVEHSGRVSFDLRGGLRLRSDAALTAAFAAVFAWADASPAFSGLRGAVSFSSDFWRASLLGILTETPGWPVTLASGPDQALDTRAGLQGVARVEAGTGAFRGWTEIRVLDGPVLTVEVGLTLGAR